MPASAEPIRASQQRLDLADPSVLPVSELAGHDGGPLLRWYEGVKRDLPWRQTSDPYGIWVSEIMLQQTQVATVIPYWLRWMSQYPTVESLACASDQDVLSIWQGLGYYRRCRMLLSGARWIVDHGMPTNRDQWLSVPGVGPYTAGAIASIALSEPVPLVDGNVERVYARLTGDASLKPALTASAWAWAERELFRLRSGDWNQALMELGATVCRPVNPECPVCPLQDVCVARLTFRIGDLPSKQPQRQTVRLGFHLWVPYCQGRYGLRQIPEGQWWEGMWEFPREPSEELLRAAMPTASTKKLGRIRHAVTHHRISLEVSRARLEGPDASLSWFTFEQLEALPMPAAQRKALLLAIGESA